MLRCRFGEVAQRDLERIAVLCIQLTAMNLLGHRDQQAQKILDATVTVAEHSEWIAEVVCRRCADLDHGHQATARSCAGSIATLTLTTREPAASSSATRPSHR